MILSMKKQFVLSTRNHSKNVSS